MKHATFKIINEGETPFTITITIKGRMRWTLDSLMREPAIADAAAIFAGVA